MEKSSVKLKGILRLEERLLTDLLKALPLVSDVDARLLLRDIVMAKKMHIRTYKAAIRKNEKPPRPAKSK